MNFIGKACALNNSYTLCDILMIFGINVYQVKAVCCVQELLLPLLKPTKWADAQLLVEREKQFECLPVEVSRS